jgi:hypothetical protein
MVFGGCETMPGEFVQKDFVESMFHQDLEVSQELYDYVMSYQMEKIDHVETSFYRKDMDLRLAEMTMRCVEDFFVEIGKRIGKTSLQLLKIWVQRYEQYSHHAIHIHAPDAHNYSFVFYIDCTEHSAGTMFYSLGYPYVDHTNYTVQPLKGRCVVFPGAMPHEALPNKDNRRVIVSGNFVYFDKELLDQNPNLNLGVTGAG